jgi:hypothetical protein
LTKNNETVQLKAVAHSGKGYQDITRSVYLMGTNENSMHVPSEKLETIKRLIIEIN